MSAALPLTTRQQALVLEAKPTIDLMARVVARRAPCVVEELSAVGYEVAVRATKRFDEGLGIPFHLFIMKAVRGAMLDAAFPKHTSRQLYLNDADPASMPAPVEASFEEAELTPLEDRTLGIILSASFPSGAALERAGWNAHVVSTLRHVIAELPAEERALAQAFYWDGLTLQQASARLNVPVRTLHREHVRVKAKLLRALRRHDVAGLG